MVVSGRIYAWLSLLFLGAAVIFPGAIPPAHAETGGWPKPEAPAIPDATGYVHVPGAALALDKTKTYKALFVAKAGSPTPNEVLPMFLRVGSELNGLALAGVPREHIKFAVLFYSAAVDSLMNNTKYNAQHGFDNPNLKIIKELQDTGVDIFVCSQHLAKHDIPRSDLITGVKVGEAATMVMITLSNEGYALIPD